MQVKFLLSLHLQTRSKGVELMNTFDKTTLSWHSKALIER